jgi:hypothetical protein
MRSEAPGYAGGGNKFDLGRWNPEYFARYKQYVSDASKLGIVVEISLFSSYYGQQQWDMSPLNPTNNVNNPDRTDWRKAQTIENGDSLKFQEAYVRKLVHEANEFDNVIFEIQNEPWSDRPQMVGVVNPYLQKPARDQYPNSIEIADEFSAAWQERVAEWITSEEASLPNKHLIAQNYSNFRFPVRKLLPQTSVVNFHYAYPEAATENYGLGKALSYDETGFLGRDDDAYRRQAWNFMLSGGGAFDALDYSFSPGREDGSDNEPNGPGGGSAAFRKQLSILKNFLQRFDLVELKLDLQTVKSCSGSSPHVLSNPGREYAMYLDGNGPAELQLDLPQGNYSAEWFNVRMGSIERTEDFHHAGAIKRLTAPPFSGGIALRIVRTN